MARKPKSNTKASPEQASLKDMCQTPPRALSLILPYLKPQWTIWEPASGLGFIAMTLESHGHKVISTDIVTGQNFLTHKPDEDVDAVVTNPPYSTAVKYPFIARCYELGLPFALLMAIETLGSSTAQEYFKNDPDFCVIIPNQRINFFMPTLGWEGSGSQFPTAWFTSGFGIGERMIFADLVGPDIRPVKDGKGYYKLPELKQVAMEFAY